MSEPQSEEQRCRHRGTWIIAGGHAEWCYECGAFRGLAPVPGYNQSYARTYWARPTGIGGKNPWPLRERPPHE